MVVMDRQTRQGGGGQGATQPQSQFGSEERGEREERGEPEKNPRKRRSRDDERENSPTEREEQDPHFIYFKKLMTKMGKSFNIQLQNTYNLKSF